MLHFYHIIFTMFYKGKKINENFASTICEESEAIEKEITLNWQNIEELKKKCSLTLPIIIYETKKGRKCVLFSKTEYKFFSPVVKEWKTDDFQATIQIKYNEYTPSLNEVFNWGHSEKAIQYLKERYENK